MIYLLKATKNLYKCIFFWNSPSKTVKIKIKITSKLRFFLFLMDYEMIQNKIGFFLLQKI